MAGPGKKKLGEMLVEARVLDPLQLESALGHQRNWGGKIGKVLVERQFVSEADVVEALSRQFGVTRVSLATEPVQPDALAAVPLELARRLHVLPVKFNGTGRSAPLVVAATEPSDLGMIDELGFKTGRRIELVLAGEREIDAGIRYYYEGGEYPAEWREGTPAPRAGLSGADGIESLPEEVFSGQFETVFEEAPLGAAAEDWHLDSRVPPDVELETDEVTGVLELSEEEIEPASAESQDGLRWLDDDLSESNVNERQQGTGAHEGNWAEVEDPLAAADDPLSDPSEAFAGEWDVSELDFSDATGGAPRSGVPLGGGAPAPSLEIDLGGETAEGFEEDLADWSESEIESTPAVASVYEARPVQEVLAAPSGADELEMWSEDPLGDGAPDEQSPGEAVDLWSAPSEGAPSSDAPVPSPEAPVLEEDLWAVSAGEKDEDIAAEAPVSEWSDWELASENPEPSLQIDISETTAEPVEFLSGVADAIAADGFWSGAEADEEDTGLPFVPPSADGEGDAHGGWEGTDVSPEPSLPIDLAEVTPESEEMIEAGARDVLAGAISHHPVEGDPEPSLQIDLEESTAEPDALLSEDSPQTDGSFDFWEQPLPPSPEPSPQIELEESTAQEKEFPLAEDLGSMDEGWVQPSELDPEPSLQIELEESTAEPEGLWDDRVVESEGGEALLSPAADQRSPLSFDAAGAEAAEEFEPVENPAGQPPEGSFAVFESEEWGREPDAPVSLDQSVQPVPDEPSAVDDILSEEVLEVDEEDVLWTQPEAEAEAEVEPGGEHDEATGEGDMALSFDDVAEEENAEAGWEAPETTPGEPSSFSAEEGAWLEAEESGSFADRSVPVEAASVEEDATAGERAWSEPEGAPATAAAGEPAVEEVDEWDGSSWAVTSPGEKVPAEFFSETPLPAAPEGGVLDWPEQTWEESAWEGEPNSFEEAEGAQWSELPSAIPGEGELTESGEPPSAGDDEAPVEQEEEGGWDYAPGAEWTAPPAEATPADEPTSELALDGEEAEPAVEQLLVDDETTGTWDVDREMGRAWQETPDSDEAGLRERYEDTMVDPPRVLVEPAALLGAIGLEAPAVESGEAVDPSVAEEAGRDRARMESPAAVVSMEPPHAGELREASGSGWALLGIDQPDAETAVRLVGLLVERLASEGLVDPSSLAAALRGDEEKPER